MRYQFAISPDVHARDLTSWQPMSLDEVEFMIDLVDALEQQ